MSEALEVLRAIWRAQGQTAAELADVSCEKSCNRITQAGVGYEDFADGTDSTDLAAAWRARLAREGKLNKDGGTVRDLVLGTPRAR